MNTVTAATITPPPARRGPQAWLRRLGEAMAQHRRVILGIQWTVVISYVFLVAVPAFLELPADDAHLWGNLTRLAQFAFWGVWWPFVILSMMLLGRAWCGVFCPEGTLTEAASRHGLGRAIPPWMRWGGWPFVAFALTTVYGQLISVYEYPKAVLLILGGSTVAAVIVGFVYGRGTRVWCRHLCPVSGVFGLLARLAPLHFRTDEAAWKHAPSSTPAVKCAPLVDLRHLRSAAPCHACGRCSGHRGAVWLTARSPNSEILSLHNSSRWEALLLVFGLLGIALGAFQWSASPWFVAVKQAAATWLVEHDIFWPLADNAPWWLLTHYPEVNDVFTWLDGVLIAGYIGTETLVVGGAIFLGLHVAQRLLRQPGLQWRLAYSLIPLAGMNVFLGLSLLTVTLLRAEGLALAWVPAARLVLLMLGLVWSAWLGLRLTGTVPAPLARRAGAVAALWFAQTLVPAMWFVQFFIW